MLKTEADRNDFKIQRAITFIEGRKRKITDTTISKEIKRIVNNYTSEYLNMDFFREINIFKIQQPVSTFTGTNTKERHSK